MEIIKGEGQDTYVTNNKAGAEFIRAMFDGNNAHSLEYMYDELDEDAKATVKQYLEWNDVYKDKVYPSDRYVLIDDIKDAWRHQEAGDWDDFDEFFEFYYEKIDISEFV